MSTVPYYEEDGIAIYHGDCAEVLPSLAIESPGLVLTDPPYGIGVRYGPGSTDARPDYWPWMVERVKDMRATAPVVVFTHRVKALAHLHDWDWVGSWRKPNPTGTGVGNSPVVPAWEPIFMYGIYSLGTRNRVFAPDVFSFNAERNPDLNGLKGRASWAKNDVAGHPVPKPEGLWRALLAAFGQGGGTVIDPFLGSGTTLRVAKDADRLAIGIEIEERYCDLAARRLAQGVLGLEGAA